ncbi:alanine racemase, partial [Vibrio parahaemolyticus V-223/04]
ATQEVHPMVHRCG